MHTDAHSCSKPMTDDVGIRGSKACPTYAYPWLEDWLEAMCGWVAVRLESDHMSVPFSKRRKRIHPYCTWRSTSQSSTCWLPVSIESLLAGLPLRLAACAWGLSRLFLYFFAPSLPEAEYLVDQHRDIRTTMQRYVYYKSVCLVYLLPPVGSPQ